MLITKILLFPRNINKPHYFTTYFYSFKTKKSNVFNILIRVNLNKDILKKSKQNLLV